MNNERLKRESKFHDQRFKLTEDEYRKPVKKYYSITKDAKAKHRNIVKNICLNNPQCQLLEVGCGIGGGLHWHEFNANITGIDLSEVAINKSKQLAQIKNIDANYFVANAEEAGLPA